MRKLHVTVHKPKSQHLKGTTKPHGANKSHTNSISADQKFTHQSHTVSRGHKSQTPVLLYSTGL
jgi:hypothetical protein